jgi:hypothetical protein
MRISQITDADAKNYIAVTVTSATTFKLQNCINIQEKCNSQTVAMSEVTFIAVKLNE